MLMTNLKEPKDMQEKRKRQAKGQLTACNRNMMKWCLNGETMTDRWKNCEQMLMKSKKR